MYRRAVMTWHATRARNAHDQCVSRRRARPDQTAYRIRPMQVAAGMAVAVTLVGFYVALVGPPEMPQDARASLPPRDVTAPGNVAPAPDDPVSTGPQSPTAGMGSAPQVTLRWPIKPFDEPHPIRGTFGEPRGIFGAGYDNATGPRYARLMAALDPVTTPGTRTLHPGIDIMGEANQAVYAVQDGVARTGGSGQDTWVEVGDYRYVHIRPTVADGARVEAHATKIGEILPGDEHVHLTRTWRGRPVNPLAFGAFVGWQDTAPPVLGRLRVFDADGTESSQHRLKGRVAIFVRARDPQSQGGQQSGIYLLSYRLLNRDGVTVAGPHTVFELRHEPGRTDRQRLYTSGSTRHDALPNFFYRVTLREPDGLLDSARVRPGRYTLEITAADVAGNVTTRAYPLRNRPQGQFLADFPNAR